MKFHKVRVGGVVVTPQVLPLGVNCVNNPMRALPEAEYRLVYRRHCFADVKFSPESFHRLKIGSGRCLFCFEPRSVIEPTFVRLIPRLFETV